MDPRQLADLLIINELYRHIRATHGSGTLWVLATALVLMHAYGGRQIQQRLIYGATLALTVRYGVDVLREFSIHTPRAAIIGAILVVDIMMPSSQLASRVSLYASDWLLAEGPSGPFALFDTRNVILLVVLGAWTWLDKKKMAPPSSLPGVLMLYAERLIAAAAVPIDRSPMAMVSSGLATVVGLSALWGDGVSTIANNLVILALARWMNGRGDGIPLPALVAWAALMYVLQKLAPGTAEKIFPVLYFVVGSLVATILGANLEGNPFHITGLLVGLACVLSVLDVGPQSPTPSIATK